jgi:hypothetical protein
MAEKSERTKKLEEAKIEDDPLYVKRAIRGLGVGMSRMADKVGFTQDEKKEEPVKKAKGGSVNESKMMKKEGRGMAKADMQKIASGAVKKHEKSMHGMKSGGYVKAADGVCKKGKTKGRMV